VRVFKYQTAESAASLMPPDLRGAGKPFDRLRGHPLEAASWRSVVVRAVTDGSAGPTRSDFATVWTEPALSGRAAKALRELVSSCAELLPLATDIGDYFVLNVLTVPDALDEATSELTHFSTGRVMQVKRYSFRPQVIRDVPAFKIPQMPRAPVFLSEQFIRRAHELELTGLDPLLVWEA
jgi:hypothetical protein